MIDPFLSALEDVVRPDRRLQLQPNTCFVIREAGAAATLTHINIDCRGCNEVFAFSLDVRNGGRAIPLSQHTSKAPNSKWNKVCDAVFVWRDNVKARWRVLVCDLKSSTPSGGDWMEQLWSSACFVHYLIAIVRRFHPAVPEAAPIEWHGVVFYGGTHLSGRGKRKTGVVPGIGYPSTNLDSPGRISTPNCSYIPLRALCS